jgi:hypothetical protein
MVLTKILRYLEIHVSWQWMYPLRHFPQGVFFNVFAHGSIAASRWLSSLSIQAPEPPESQWLGQDGHHLEDFSPEDST